MIVLGRDVPPDTLASISVRNSSCNLTHLIVTARANDTNRAVATWVNPESLQLCSGEHAGVLQVGQDRFVTVGELIGQRARWAVVRRRIRSLRGGHHSTSRGVE